jgi:hypothetical protein
LEFRDLRKNSVRIFRNSFFYSSKFGNLDIFYAEVRTQKIGFLGLALDGKPRTQKKIQNLNPKNIQKIQNLNPKKIQKSLKFKIQTQIQNPIYILDF